VTHIVVTPNLEIDPWHDLDPTTFLGYDPTVGQSARITRVGMVPNGTTQGRATVALVITLPDGRTVLAETTWRLFQGIALALASTPVALMEGL